MIFAPPAARQLAGSEAARGRARARAWREETARAQDRPIPSVLSDAALIEVAKRRPSAIDQLEQIRGINEPTLRRRGKRDPRGRRARPQRPPIPVEGERPAQPSALDAPVIALAEALVRTRALEMRAGLRADRRARRPAARSCSRCATAAPPPDVRTLQGWRREVVGDELLELLDGRRSLTVGPDRHVAVTERDADAAATSG